MPLRKRKNIHFNTQKMEAFSPKLDKISENIIYLLSLDSRKTISALAAELNLSRKIVEHRVNKLFHQKYITPLAVTNEANRIYFTVLVKLRTIDESIVGKVQQLPGLLKLKETLGLYDLSLLFNIDAQTGMEDTISELSTILDNKILSYEVVFHDFEDTLGYKSFCHDARHLQKYTSLQHKPITLSEKELLVLRAIKNKPLISYIELSQQTSLTYKSLKETQDAILQKGILRFSIDPDYEKLGLNFHNILVKIRLGKRKMFERYIQHHPHIHWVKHSQGRWDYILSVAARNINEFIDVSKKIRADNSNILQDETSLISKVQEMRRH